MDGQIDTWFEKCIGLLVACIHIYTPINKQKRICIYDIYIYMHIHLFIHLCTYLFLYVCICMYVAVDMYTYLHMYT